MRAVGRRRAETPRRSKINDRLDCNLINDNNDDSHGASVGVEDDVDK